MHRRRSRRTPSLPHATTRTWTTLLALVLLAVSGPGATATRAPARTAPDTAPAVIATDPVADLAASLDYDPDRIFRYVADEIRYEPYPGLLRGARGTVAAGAGNSVDKAVLLAALLDASLVLHRFARGPLDDAATTALLDTMATDVEGARRIAEGPLVSGLEQVASGNASPPPATSGSLGPFDEEQVRSVEADGITRLELAQARLGATVAMIEDALQGAGIQLPPDRDVSLPLSETADHTWVQMGSGPEWVDLDPTLPGSQPGTVVAQARETLTELPDDLRYRVEFDVLVERVSGGQLTTDQALTYSGFADELAEVPVTFGHVTPSGLKTLGLTLSSLLGDGWIDYRPVLEVGNRSLVADESVAFPSGDGTDLFGTEPSATAAGPVDGEATAEWVEVHVTPPGGEPQVSRRTVFDRLPDDLRAAGELTAIAIEPLELVDFDGSGSLEFLPVLGIRTFAIATGPTNAASVAADIGDALGMFARSYHSVRDAMNAAMALDAGARTFVDGPNIVSLAIGVDGDASSHAVRVGLDIWQRDHGILPLTGPSIGVARSELVAGVLAHIAERFAVETMADAPSAPLVTVGVGEVFEAAASEGIETLVLHGTVPDSLAYGAEATSLIGAAVASGDVVVVPAKPVMLGDHERIGWWRIDPETGVTTDVMDDGSGQDMAEYTVIVDTSVGRLVCIGAMAMSAAAVIVAAATLLGSFGASSIYWTYVEGVGGTSCGAV